MDEFWFKIEILYCPKKFNSRDTCMKIAVSLQNQKINYISSFPGSSHLIKSCGQGVSYSSEENTDVKFYWEK